MANISIPHQFHIRQDPTAVGPVKSAIFCRLWSDTPEQAPCHLLQGLPTQPPVYKAGRPLFFGKDSQTTEECDKRYDNFQAHVKHIAETFKFSQAFKEEWEETFEWTKRLQSASSRPYTGFWPTEAGQLQNYLDAQPAGGPALDLAPRPEGLQEAIPEEDLLRASEAAELSTELEEKDFQGVILTGAYAESDQAIRQVYDARKGNFVILDASGAVDDTTPSEHLLGDWEREVCLGFVRERVYAAGLTQREKRSRKTEPESLEILQCEPWAVHSKTGEPVCPLWVFRDVAKAMGKDQVDTSWEAVKHLPWREVVALPVASYQAFYAEAFTNTRGETRDLDFMNSGLCAIVKLHLQDANKRQKTLLQVHPYGQLHYTCTMEDANERTRGVKLPKEALERVELSMRRAKLRKGLIDNDSRSSGLSCEDSSPSI